MTDQRTPTRSLLAVDIERWSSRGPADRRLLDDHLARVVDEALAAVRIDPSLPRRYRDAGCLVLSLPGGVPRRRLTRPFVEALRVALREQWYRVPRPDQRLRLRVALHVAPAQDEAEAMAEARRLAGGDVLRRRLRETPAGPLVVAVSPAWHDAVVGPGWLSERDLRRVQAARTG